MDFKYMIKFSNLKYIAFAAFFMMSVPLSASANALESSENTYCGLYLPALTVMDELPVSSYVGTNVTVDGIEYSIDSTYEVSVCGASKNLKTVRIPASITAYGYTFYVTSVKKNAFKNNKTIKKIVFGANIESIGSRAFYGCTNLKKIRFLGNAPVLKNKVFSDISVTVYVPYGQTKKYRKRLKKAGLKNAIYITEVYGVMSDT